MEEYNISIDQVSDNKVEISIESKHSLRRKFNIYISKDGLQISTDAALKISPKAANQVEIDSYK